MEKVKSWIKTNKKKLIEMALITLCLAIFAILGPLFGITCPFKKLTGLPCPACGATRAYVSALHLDFAKAFYYHPLFPILLPMCYYIGWGTRPLLGSKKRENALYIVFIGAVIITWLLRFIFGGNPEYCLDNFHFNWSRFDFLWRCTLLKSAVSVFVFFFL
ncbi:MAG TPA: DUF2752 domain-containing protein [Bacillota bacterium]|nr:DUF2752 domain-containing protein [Bacillota bacterium]